LEFSLHYQFLTFSLQEGGYGEAYSKIALLTPNESSQGQIGCQKQATTVCEDSGFYV